LLRLSYTLKVEEERRREKMREGEDERRKEEKERRRRDERGRRWEEKGNDNDHPRQSEVIEDEKALLRSSNGTILKCTIDPYCSIHFSFSALVLPAHHATIPDFDNFISCSRTVISPLN
jgi:hypothetical protein